MHAGLVCSKKASGSDFAPALLDLTEDILGFRVVRHTCFYNRLRPLGVMDGIGIILGLQTNTATAGIGNALLARIIHEITGIELDAGTIGHHLHGTAGNRIRQGCAGIACKNKVMVITILQMQRLIIHQNISAYDLGRTEIHRRSHYTAQFTGGNALCICYGKELRIDGKDLLQSTLRMFMA